VWVTVGNANVYIKLDKHNAVKVNVYAKGKEDEDPLREAYVSDSELLEE
jgi:hypothetical protein